VQIVSRAGLAAGLRRALSGQGCIGVVPQERPEPYLAMLAPDEPLEHPEAAIAIATSGSTGNPKGVLLSAAAVEFMVAATHDFLGGPGHWVCALPVHHIAGFMTLARGVVSGLGTSFADPSLVEPLPELGGFARKYISLVPAQLLKALAAAPASEWLAGFDAILLGGSAIPEGLVERAAQAGLRVVITYGMSETCGGCVYDRYPLAGVELGFEPVDGGQRLTIASPGNFLSYRLDPEATRQVLEDGRVRTRDLGYLRGGKLYVTGRLDDVVVSGGENVDLAQAQAVADRLLGPEVLALLDVPDARFGARIVAATTSAAPDAELLALLGGQLERAAMPKEIRRVGSLPRNPGGKIDRASLRKEFDGDGR
jgi:O-succinylbenzoic acid--CoA ligase